jgi:hypothetical protein
VICVIRADVMLYGVSLAYKESANCRLEANYAHQQELDMIPLMMQKDYKPQGWRKYQYQNLSVFWNTVGVALI